MRRRLTPYYPKSEYLLRIVSSISFSYLMTMYGHGYSLPLTVGKLSVYTKLRGCHEIVTLILLATFFGATMSSQIGRASPYLCAPPRVPVDCR